MTSEFISFNSTLFISYPHWGYNAFMSNFVAHNAALTEVKDLRNNLRKWAQTQPIDTPISISHPTQASD